MEYNLNYTLVLSLLLLMAFIKCRSATNNSDINLYIVTVELKEKVIPEVLKSDHYQIIESQKINKTKNHWRIKFLLKKINHETFIEKIDNNENVLKIMESSDSKRIETQGKLGGKISPFKNEK